MMQLPKLFRRKIKVSTTWLLLLAFISTSVGLYQYFPEVQALIGGRSSGGPASYGAGKTVRQPAPIGNAAHAYYPMDGNANNALVNSQSNLSDMNTVTQANTKNLAGSFARANTEYLSIADNAALSMNNNSFSVSAWVYLDSVATSQMFVAKLYDDGGTVNSYEYGIFYNHTLSRFRMIIGGGSSFQTVTADTFGAPTTGKWYFITAWHNQGQDINIQINNGAIDTQSWTSGVNDTPRGFRIGNSALDTQAAAADGRIDSVGIWKKALSTGEKDFLYNGGRGQGYANLGNHSGLTTSLTAWWNLDEASGTRNDSVGSNHLTDNNTVGSNAGIVGLATGNAGQFAASSTEYLTVADNEALSTGATNFTLAAWVYLDTKPTYGRIASKWQSGGSNATLEYSLAYIGSTDRFYFEVGNSSAYFNVAANTLGSPSLQRWYYVMGYYDLSTSKIYISVNNGAADETAFTGTPRDGTANFSIGRPGDYPGDYWNGRIDEVAFWKRSLSTAEKTSLYNGGQGVTYVSLPSALKTSLYGWWTLDEPSGTRYDSHRYAKYNATGAGATGTNNTPQITNSGKFKQAYNFDGTDDYLVTPTGIDYGGTNKASVSMWFYPTNNTDTGQVLFTWVPTDYQGIQIDWRNTTTTNCYFGVGNPWGVASVDSSTIALDMWHHIACVYDGDLGSNNITMYIDGVAVANGNKTGSFTSSSITPAYIGNYKSSQTSFGFHGNIDDVRLHTTALSSNEVESLYGGSKSPNCDQTCKAHWKLDETTTPTARDETGNSNNALSQFGTVPSTTGKIGTGSSYDGTLNFLTANDTESLKLGGNSFTVSAWVKHGTAPSGSKGIATKGNGGSFNTHTNYEWWVGWGTNSSSKFSMIVQSGSGSNQVHSSTLDYTSTSDWYFVVWWFDDATDTLGISVNGAENTLGSYTKTPTDTTQPLRVGSDGTRNWNGTIDELGYWKRALSSTERSSLYNSASGKSYASLTRAEKSGLVSYWGMDEASGSRTDSHSGTGVITSVTTASEGVFNSGYKFNGSSSSVLTADNTVTDGLSAMTVSAWVNVASDHNGMIVSKSDGTDGWYLYARLSGSDAFRFGMNNGGASTNIDWSYGSGYPTGWHLFTGVWDGSNMYLYWDGVLKAQGALSGGTTSNTSHPTYIGRMDSVSPLYFNGSIDDVRIYSRGLSANEVFDQYTTGRP